MDELIIGEQKYVSSKRAAELTGYAKDYIGQLCREGRVEARLVGRSWYVREAAIKDHRFGAENESMKDETIKVVGDTQDEVESAKYEIEVPKELPLIKEEESVEVQEVQTEQHEENMADRMQKAWQDWFSANTSGQGEETAIEEESLPAQESQEQESVEERKEVEEDSHIKIVKLGYKPNIISDMRDSIYTEVESDVDGDGEDSEYVEEASNETVLQEPRIIRKRYVGLRICLTVIAVVSVTAVAMNFLLTTTSTKSDGGSGWYNTLNTILGSKNK